MTVYIAAIVTHLLPFVLCVLFVLFVLFVMVSLPAGNDIGIQGNLDPAILFGDHATIKVCIIVISLTTRRRSCYVDNKFVCLHFT